MRRRETSEREVLQHDQEHQPAPWVTATPGFLSLHRVAVPSRVTDYLHRPDLTDRCMPTKRPLTLIEAPAGFGKTTLLSECCRILASRNVPAAWLTLEESDQPASLETYLYSAFQRAGLNVLDILRAGDGTPSSPPPLAAVLAKLLEHYERPCVLVLDELDRLQSPEAMAMINQLVGDLPSGLHLAFAYRALPRTLDIAAPVLQGAAEILTADDLRFTDEEIYRFAGAHRSKRELKAIALESAGWPTALRLIRDRGAEDEGSRGQQQAHQQIGERWIESSLFRNLSTEDRDFLLDVGLLERIDAELLDASLAGLGLLEKLLAMPTLSGLIEPVRGRRKNVWRLHPLIRKTCADLRRRTTPERYRAIHRRIANALTTRGDTVAGMRHASHASDAALVGRILMDSGGLMFWLREGPNGLIAAGRYLTEEVLGLYPRLRLMRALIHVTKGEFAEAQAIVESVAGTLSQGNSDATIDLQVDICLARGLLAQRGCESVGSAQGRALVRNLMRIAELPHVDPIARCTVEHALCTLHNLKAEFDLALQQGARARRRTGTLSAYLEMALDYQYGQIAMARGQVKEATQLYKRALRTAKRAMAVDPGLTTIGRVLIDELNFERDRKLRFADEGRVSDIVMQGTLQFAAYAAACYMAAEQASEADGVEAALATIDVMSEFARGKGMKALTRYTQALRISTYAGADLVEEAQREWRLGDFPDSNRDCLDLDGQSWREMEALTCARLRLQVATGNLDDGRRLIGELLKLAEGRELLRTRMRALSIAVVLEESNGQRGAALEHLADYLKLHVQTDYARPFLRERAIVLPVARAFLETDADETLRDQADALMAAAGRLQRAALPRFSPREKDVLSRLDAQTDAKIAAALNLTHAGVRYHIQRIFDKLRVNDRASAARRARSLGVLPSTPSAIGSDPNP